MCAQALNFQGRLKYLHRQDRTTEGEASGLSELALFAIATPVQPPAILEIRTRTLFFQSKHKLDFTPVGMDTRWGSALTSLRRVFITVNCLFLCLPGGRWFWVTLSRSCAWEDLDISSSTLLTWCTALTNTYAVRFHSHTSAPLFWTLVLWWSEDRVSVLQWWKQERAVSPSSGSWVRPACGSGSRPTLEWCSRQANPTSSSAVRNPWRECSSLPLTLTVTSSCSPPAGFL